MKNVVANIISVRLANGTNRPALTITYEVIGVGGGGLIEQANFTAEPTLTESTTIPRFIQEKVVADAATRNWDIKRLVMQHVYVRKIGI